MGKKKKSVLKTIFETSKRKISGSLNKLEGLTKAPLSSLNDKWRQTGLKDFVEKDFKKFRKELNKIKTVGGFFIDYVVKGERKGKEYDNTVRRKENNIEAARKVAEKRVEQARKVVEKAKEKVEEKQAEIENKKLQPRKLDGDTKQRIMYNNMLKSLSKIRDMALNVGDEEMYERANDAINLIQEKARRYGVGAVINALREHDTDTLFFMQLFSSDLDSFEYWVSEKLNIILGGIK